MARGSNKVICILLMNGWSFLFWLRCDDECLLPLLNKAQRVLFAISTFFLKICYVPRKIISNIVQHSLIKFSERIFPQSLKLFIKLHITHCFRSLFCRKNLFHKIYFKFTFSDMTNNKRKGPLLSIEIFGSGDESLWFESGDE